MISEASAALKQNPQRLSRLERIQQAVEAREQRKFHHQLSPALRMIISPWYDELGVPTRQIRAAD
jgi:hypothetical protein